MSECLGWLVVAHSNANCMAAASSANDEVNAVTLVENSRIRWVDVGHDYFRSVVLGSSSNRAVSGG